VSAAGAPTSAPATADRVDAVPDAASGALRAVSGMHRSGTTLVGRILARHAGVQVVHEPLNAGYGLAGVDRVYPCDLDAAQARQYVDRLHGMLAGHAACVRRAPGDPPWKAVARALTGGRTGMDLARLRLRRTLHPVAGVVPIVKDPFVLLLTDAITREGGRVLVLVRHPAAVWLSLKRMGWRFDYQTFACPDFFEWVGAPVPPGDAGGGTELEKMAYLWTGLYAYVRRLLDRPSVCLVRHEELCLDPFGTLARIEDFFGLGPSPAARRFVEAHMFGGAADVDDATLHVLKRDARALATAWHGRIAPEEEAALREVCGAEVARYYGAWRPA
jgi:Sulfotransferase family